MRLGVCCIITELRQKDIYCGRTCQKASFSLDRVNNLIVQNCKDLITHLEYCKEHAIKAFRIGSDLFPRYSEGMYTLDQLKDFSTIKNYLQVAGKFAADHDIILSCHPGPFTILGSKTPNVSDNAIKEVEYHSLIGDLLSQSVPHMQFAINFHVGCKYDDSVIPSWIAAYNKLSKNAASRVTLENDDKASCWSIKKLLRISQETGVPLVWDMHHSSFSRASDVSLEEEFHMAMETWKSRPAWMPEIHIAESASSEKNIPKHSDLIENELPAWLMDKPVYALFEAKLKEQSLFHYRKKYNVEI